jgi:hypothetical protein
MNKLEILWVVALVIALAGIGGVVLLRRKPKAGPPADTLFSTIDERSPDGGAPLDPVAEAEVYLAYGNKQQALTVLRKAALEHPERADVLAKIREIRQIIEAEAGEK